MPWTIERYDGATMGNIVFTERLTHLYYRFLIPWISRRFQKTYHMSNAWVHNHWRNVTCMKDPCDLLMYQEIVVENKPDIIIECGTFCGGSAFFLADVCDLIGHGLVATIDIATHCEVPIRLEDTPREFRPKHSRILYIVGADDTNVDTLTYLKQYIQPETKVMVILDSDHTYPHVKKQLELYSELVTEGQYLIVEDTNVGWLIKKQYRPGPLKAIEEFLAKHPEFYIDYDRERNLLTNNSSGYLRKRPLREERKEVVPTCTLKVFPEEE